LALPVIAPVKRWRHRLAATGLRRFGVPGLAACLGALLSFGWFFVIRGWERESLRHETRKVSSERVELLRGRLLGSMEVLHSVTALQSARSGEVSRGEFREFVREALARHPEIQALSWNPLVPAARRAEYEAAARRDGLADFGFREINAQGRLLPAGLRAEYAPVYFEEPSAGNEPSFGFDLLSSAARKATLDRARDTGAPAATAPLRLVQERGDQLGFLVLCPIYRGPSGTLAERRAHLAGFASAVFRVGDLMQLALGKTDPRELDLSIRDAASGELLIHFRDAEPSVGPDAAGQRWTQTLDFPGGAWRLDFQPMPAFLAARAHSWQSWTGLAGGLMMTLLAVGYLWRGQRRTAEIERRVQARTAELSAEVAGRKRVERALREAEAKYRSIFENSIEGIFQTTADGRYLSANPALARLYGYPTPESLIADLADIERRLYVEPGRRAEFIRRVQQHGSVEDFESQIRRKDGRLIWISETARVVREGGAGEVLYYEGAVSDVTERRLADENLRTSHDALESRVAERTDELARANAALRVEVAERQRAEAAAAAANAAKSDFLAHMSHEIRTPLNAILGYAQILRRDSTLRAAHRPAVETIAASGSHLLGLIDDVLDLSKIEAGHMELCLEPFDLRALLQRLETLFAHQCQSRGLMLKVEAPAGLSGAAPVCGDEGKLRQALINLLGNAVKFTDAGEVCLRVTLEEGNRFRFAVSDTGMGVAPEALAAIFEPFQQAGEGRRKGGTGLGLTISRRQIELMGGRLEVASAPGKGACFFFELPLPPAAGRMPDARMVSSTTPADAFNAADHAPPDPRDLPPLPADLLARLQSAAELYSLTGLRVCVEELTRLGARERRLAQRLERWLDACDMESILRYLDEGAAALASARHDEHDEQLAAPIYS
jgi:PAS domain S-box-containing protein